MSEFWGEFPLPTGDQRHPGRAELVDDVSPVTGQVITRVAAATPDDAVGAVRRAAAAFEGWAGTSFVVRRGILLAAAEILESEIDSHREIFALETGSVAAWAEMNVREAAATLREAAGLASSPRGELLPSSDPRTVVLSRRGPAGVVLAIVPWNAPLVLAARASAIALALGNTVVLRPSELAPITAGHLLADALRRAGLPDGVLNVITNAPADGPAVIAAMIDRPEVRRVVFIGSTHVGREIGVLAGRALTPVVLELGGKNATIVRDDADLDSALPLVAFGAFANSGQICMSTDRLIVPRTRVGEVLERLASIADSMQVGDPRRAETDLGPLISPSAVAGFDSLLDDARRAGALVVAGGTRDGLLVRPTVLANVPSDCRYHAEEGFVPMVEVVAVDDDEQAVAVANEGGFGLIASVFSSDLDAADALATQLRAGAVHVNGPSVGDEPHVPFGGLGASGAGRLGGADSVAFFTEQRTFFRHPVPGG